MPNFPALPRPIGATVLVLAVALTAALALPASSLSAPGPIALDVSPSPASFPKTTVGEKSSLEIDIANEGEEATIEKIVIEGADQADFTNPGNSCGTLAEGQHCILSVAFMPDSTGEKHATAFIRFSGGVRSEESFELTGTAVAPHLAFTPASHDFGVQAVNSGAQSTTFQLENDGEGPVQVGSYDFTDWNGFWFGNSDCSGRFMQPGETCSIQVFFGPNNTGSYSTKLRVYAGGEYFIADLAGEGARPEVEASPNPVEFGAATVGSTGSTQTITLTNSGRIPTAFFIAVVSGGDSGSFRLLDEGCTGVQLQPTDSCTVHVRFAPLSAGKRAATLSMFGEGDGGAQVSLRGEGIAPAVGIAPAEFDFGSQAQGGKSAAHSFAVRNDGSAPVELDAASIVGADLDQFALAGDTCSGVTLGAGEECLLSVRFAPDGVGTKAATLRVRGDAVSLTASLSGTGAAQPAAAPHVSFHWRSASRALRRGAILAAGTARCYLAKSCRVMVSPQLKVARHPRAGGLQTRVARLPKLRLQLSAERSRPIEVRLSAAARELLGSGRATLRLKVTWTADGQTGRVFTSTPVR